ncbi:MAG: GRP family sugar transporter [Bryobacteraceae bacterium]|jgi:glucose uptake protein
MILPSSYGVLLILLIFGMFAWGAWANTLKATAGKWRFELYCFDFAIGLLLASIVLALTWGNLGFDGFSFRDDLQLAGKRQDLFAFVAGCVFNLGNMLLLGALSLVGMSVAFPVALGFALVVGVCWNFALHPGGSPAVSFIGAVAAVGGVVAAILAYRVYAEDRLQPIVETGKTKSRKNTISSKGIVLALAGGLFLGSFSPLVVLAKTGENGLGPYSTGFIFAVGVFFSTFVYNLFFMNLPVKGDPIDLGEYFRAPVQRHGMGVLGGILWYIGAIASLVGGRVEGAAKVQPPIVYVLGQGGMIIAALCGLLIWNEFDRADSRVKTYLALTLVLLAIGIGIVTTTSPVPAY